MNGNIRYCALTTLSASLKSFMLPALLLLKEHGFDISVSCAADDAFREAVADTFAYYPLDIARGVHFRKTVKTIFYLRKLFAEKKFQMIEYGTENVAFCAAIAGWMARVPVRIYDHWGARYVGLSGLSRELSIFIEKTAAFFSTDIRQVSPKNAELCVKQRLYPVRKVKVLGKGGTVGVDFDRFDADKREKYRKKTRARHTVPQSAFVYGFVGRIQRDKGINELIEAFRHEEERHSDIYLMLVGPIDSENPVAPNLMLWAEENERVIFAGSTTEIPQYMSAFDVLVHPTYREGFGMVLQEAAAVKTPIITTDIIGPGEFIMNGETGRLVPPRDASALYRAMEELYADSRLREKYAEQCYRYTKANFERSVMLERILNDRKELAKRLNE